MSGSQKAGRNFLRNNATYDGRITDLGLRVELPGTILGVIRASITIPPEGSYLWHGSESNFSNLPIAWKEQGGSWLIVSVHPNLRYIVGEIEVRDGIRDGFLDGQAKSLNREMIANDKCAILHVQYHGISAVQERNVWKI